MLEPPPSSVVSNPSQRPQSFDRYIGQRHNVDQLKVYVQAALARGTALDHVL